VRKQHTTTHNNISMKTVLTWLSTGLGVLFLANPTQAATFAEFGDAGESLLNAATITSRQSQPLESISGSLLGDADLFKIFLTGNQTFSATTFNSDTIGIPIDNELGNPSAFVGDPRLFLLDAFGKGVYANDDLFGSTQATLTSGGLSPLAPGVYFLGISSSSLNPISADGEIFPSALFDQVVGPTGPGGNSPLAGFAGSSNTSGIYRIALTGAQTIATGDDPASVPEPAIALSLLILGAGLTVSKASQSVLSPKFR
jgi:hypothetical protein